MTRQDVEAHLRTVLAAIPDGEVWSTSQVVAAIGPDDNAAMVYAQVGKLGKALGLCQYGEPEPGAGYATGKMIRRKQWRRLPHGTKIGKPSLEQRVAKLEDMVASLWRITDPHREGT